MQTMAPEKKYNLKRSSRNWDSTVEEVARGATRSPSEGFCKREGKGKRTNDQPSATVGWASSNDGGADVPGV